MTYGMKSCVVAAVALLAACQSMNEIGKQDASIGDTGGDSVCRTDLKPDVGCPSDWASAQSEPDCLVPMGLFKLGHAGSYFARVLGGGYGALVCLYSPYLDQTLVGVKVSSDVNEFCDHTSFDVVYGEQADGPFVNDLGQPPSCPDGSADRD